MIGIVINEIYVTLRSHLFKWSSLRAPSPFATTRLWLVVSDTVVLELKPFLICHVIHEEHIIKWSCNFVTRSPLQKVITLPDLVALWQWRYNFFNVSCGLT